MTKKLLNVKTLILSMFLMVCNLANAQSFSNNDLKLEAERLASEIGKPTPAVNYSQAKLAGACDLAIPITTGSITNQLLVCGNENLLNSTTVGTFCTTDANSSSEIPTGYGNGKEATYTYKPGSDGTVTITVSDITWAAIFVYNGCPTAGGTCVKATRSTGSTRTLTFNVVAGTEYFIWIDTWPTPDSPCVGGGKLSFSGPEPMVNNPDCEQGNDSNAFENGYNIASESAYRVADDFKVGANNTLPVKSITLNLFLSEPLNSVDLYFYDDNAGKPGNLVKTISGVIPYAQVPIGSNFGVPVYAVLMDVNESFAGGATGATYWMEPSVNTSGLAYWEVTTAGTLGNVLVTSENNGPWSTDEDGGQAVFKLHCDHATPPTGVCLLDFVTAVEPISRVKFADIDNTSSPALDGSPAIEDFTNVQGHVNAGSQYPIALEGNTGGDYVDYFTVFVDWNQNGSFTDAGEMYEIGSLSNSTGADGKQLLGNITVPLNAIVGTTQMKVLKNWNASPTNPCGVYDFGQAEIYTLVVQPSLGVSDINSKKFSVYPNPVKDILNIKSEKAVQQVVIYSLSGQRVVNMTQFKDGKLNVSHLPKGVYMCKVYLEKDEVKTFKIIKE